ncbi:Alpha-L-fucosidase [Novipirellula artificiosorum]|uniref:Alpha-L-fucosidase n=2 Tax=Novipirellula artificiosorum TaxID=2528016 RepID=A0A5C6D329_9BACT|nr:Alpha-L-fucosidase [Novipirellula artificiosorum]
MFPCRARSFMAMGVHHDNFHCWDSAYQPWNSVRVGPKLDVVGVCEQTYHDRHFFPLHPQIRGAHNQCRNRTDSWTSCQTDACTELNGTGISDLSYMRVS